MSQTASPLSPARTVPCIAFVTDPESRAIVANAAESVLGSVEARSGGLSAACALLVGLAIPQILILDISDSDDPFKDLDRLADMCPAGTKVIGIGEHNDVGLYRRLIHAGLSDYLVKPLDGFAIKESLHLATMQPAPVATPATAVPETASGKGKTLLVCGVRGGVGATFLASNLAWILAETHHHKTALLDADIHYGSAGLGFDVQSGGGLMDALEDPQRIDDLLLSSAAAKISPRLSFYGAEAELSTPDSGIAESMAQFSKALQEKYGWLVIDMPRQSLARSKTLLHQADTLLLVCDMSLSSLRDALRLSKLVRGICPKLRIDLIGNRVPIEKNLVIPQKDFEKALDAKFVALLTEQPKQVLTAQSHGKAMAVTAATSPLAKQLFALARHLDPAPSAVVKKSLFQRKG